MPLSNGNSLSLMAKPPVGPRHRMATLYGMAKGRHCDALHWTVIPDQDVPDWNLAVIDAVLAELAASPVALLFDKVRAKTGGNAELYCSRVPASASRLVKAICQAFADAGIVVKRGARPHVTLTYGWKEAPFDMAIDPIVWEVDRLLLIESITRQRKHVPHGTWPIVPRQGMLFPSLPCAARPGRMLVQSSG